MKLSLLICSLHERHELLKRLLAILEPQQTPEIEIITDIDNREKTIGKKRNDLISKATGTYIAFIDDDDLVSPEYTHLILKAIEEDSDCIGIEGIITTDKKNPKKFIHSIKYDSWFTENGVYYRCPNHLNPIKRTIATQIKFPEQNHGEDRVYSEGLRGKLLTETYIPVPIYFYEYTRNKSKAAPPPARRSATKQTPGVIRYSKPIIRRPKNH